MNKPAFSKVQPGDVYRFEHLSKLERFQHVVYQLRFLGIEEFYVGKATNFKQRARRHFLQLRSHKSSAKLQEAYDRAPNCEFLILEVLDTPNSYLLEIKEIEWIYRLNPSINTKTPDIQRISAIKALAELDQCIRLSLQSEQAA